jgi:hypothetical protein
MEKATLERTLKRLRKVVHIDSSEHLVATESHVHTSNVECAVVAKKCLTKTQIVAKASSPPVLDAHCGLMSSDSANTQQTIIHDACVALSRATHELAAVTDKLQQQAGHLTKQQSINHGAEM